MKALVVRLSSIGDVVHTLPALAALHRAGWEAGWVVEPPSRVLLEQNPLVAQVIVAPSRKAFGWARAFAAAARPAGRALRRGARLPGPLEVGRLDAALRRAPHARLGAAVAARAGVRTAASARA